jgi:putative transposase
LVFVTKYRDRVFDGDAINRLRAIFTKFCTDFESELVEMDGEDRHVHLLVNYPPKHSISALVNRSSPDKQSGRWSATVLRPYKVE